MAKSFFALVVGLFTAAAVAEEMKPPVIAPFDDVDTLCINDWWKKGRSKIVDLKPARDEVIAFGIYTVDNNTLKLTAQLFPLYPNETAPCGSKCNRVSNGSQSLLSR